MRKPSFRAIEWRPAALWFGLSCAIVLALSSGLFALALLTARPLLEQKFESLRYHVMELMPQPEHPEFVPTPLPTDTKVAQLAAPTATRAPTETLAPTASPSARPSATPTASTTPMPAVPLAAIQPTVSLTGWTHDYQRWNNCGPTTLEMYMSFFDVKKPQSEIASVLKPNWDDKNVRPDEMAAYAESAGLGTFVRVNGSLDRIKLFLSNGLPVVVETGFDPPRAHEGWMGHYRLITGYTDTAFITQDSYDGPNVKVQFTALDADWKAFNRTFIILYKTDQQAAIARAIIGDDLDDGKMYAAAGNRAQQELTANPQDAFAAFNLGSSLVGLGQYEEAAAAFDTARQLKLPWRMLWYQFGPYEAYIHVGRYQEVISLANATLATVNDLEESHYYKALALQALGRTAEARTELQTALRYNGNYAAAQQELASLKP